MKFYRVESAMIQKIDSENPTMKEIAETLNRLVDAVNFLFEDVIATKKKELNELRYGVYGKDLIEVLQGRFSIIEKEIEINK